MNYDFFAADLLPEPLEALVAQFGEKFFAKLDEMGEHKLKQLFQNLSATDNLRIARLFATSDYAATVVIKNPYFLLFLLAENPAVKNYLYQLLEGFYHQTTNVNDRQKSTEKIVENPVENHAENSSQNSVLKNTNQQKATGALSDFIEIVLVELFAQDTKNSAEAKLAQKATQKINKDAKVGANFQVALNASADAFRIKLEKFITTWQNKLTEADILQTALALKASASDENDLMRKVRIWRSFFQTRIIWRDTNFLQDFWQSSLDISNFAKVIIQISWQFLQKSYAKSWGTAIASDGKPMSLVVLAMGKLGACELNLSSDIDLIFTYREQGFTQGGKKSKDFHSYFTQLAQKLIAILDKVSSEGFVFRVDMRLRPYGDSGALVQSFSALLNYYQEQGRDWERYAMLKASLVNGEEEGASLMEQLRPFVYRKYLDYGAIDALRKMKAMISSEVERKNLQNNIKLGAGGIREIEFIVQVWQLIKGGKIPELQTPKIRRALPLLANLDILTQEEAASLLDAYVFLRNLEHSLQQLQDLQTQDLPLDDLAKTRVALRLGFADFATLVQMLEAKRHLVKQIFAEIIATSEDAQSIDKRWSEIWQGLQDSALQKFLQNSGFNEVKTTMDFLQNLRHSKALINMQAIGRKRLDDFMPLLLSQIAQTQAPDLVLQVSWRLVEAVLRRTSYLVLLTENPPALEQLVKICAASSKLVDRLAQMPVLLDELLSPATLYSPADKSALEAELTQVLLRSNKDDDEDFIQSLNYFRQANFLRVAASDLVAQRHIMKVSDYLTFIAEVVLNQVMHQSWRHLTQRFGLPNGIKIENEVADFLVLGYGKLGGIEMSYTSDLDLVFLHKSQRGFTDGKKQLDNLSFFTRLGQRIIHLLTATTPNGKLYEVDMRLRPSGNSGLLVSSIQAFSQYQQESAWLWEHQALVKARVICGDAKLAQEFEQTRVALLRKSRDLAQLKQEILAMRRKMQENLSAKEAEQIKHTPGGMIDIEFLAQFCVLAYSYKFAAIAIFTDVMRILDEVAASGAKAVEEVRFLQESYLLYRQESHRDSLSDITQMRNFSEQKRKVIKIWNEWLSL